MLDGRPRCKQITMKILPSDILQRLLFILHRGLSDLRYIARDGKTEQAYDLADTLENIPGYMVNWESSYFEQIKNQLERYQTKYKEVGSQDYVKYLADHPAPEEF